MTGAVTTTITILGCGSSGGVPRIGGHWGNCDPDNPKNRRRRCSILVRRQSHSGTTTVLVDTSPDMRLQLLDERVQSLDGVLYTHDHADHTHGIDDLRAIAINTHARVPVYFTAQTGDVIMTRFAYCFKTPTGSTYPPILDARLLSAGNQVEVDGEGGTLAAMPFTLTHGDIDALGFRFGNVAYTPDVSDIPDASLPFLQDLDVWIIDALRSKPHPSHFSLDDALEWIDRIKPGRAVLTNMHNDLDYAALAASLPKSVTPAHDGMVIEAE